LSDTKQLLPDQGVETVMLTWQEMSTAHHIAGQRINMNIARGKQGRYGASNGRDSDSLHLMSVRGEIAVAKAFNLFWSGSVGDYKAIDVGGRVEVRAVDKTGRRLIIHPDDHDDMPYVLADTSGAPTIVLRGWILGSAGKRPEWWEALMPHPAFFVPHQALLPMPALRLLLDETHE
jgi:hypothetical protein